MTEKELIKYFATLPEMNETGENGRILGKNLGKKLAEKKKDLVNYFIDYLHKAGKEGKMPTMVHKIYMPFIDKINEYKKEHNMPILSNDAKNIFYGALIGHIGNELDSEESAAKINAKLNVKYILSELNNIKNKLNVQKTSSELKLTNLTSDNFLTFLNFLYKKSSSGGISDNLDSAGNLPQGFSIKFDEKDKDKVRKFVEQEDKILDYVRNLLAEFKNI